MSAKPIVKRIPDIFGHADKNVRAEGTALTVALHQYLGTALAPTLAQLKEIQVKELEAKFAEAGPRQPTRFLLSQKPADAAPSDETPDAAPVQESEAPQDAEPAPAPAAVDAYELADAHDALQSRKLAKNFFEMVASAKWQERLEALESLHAALTESIRLQPDGGYEPYVQAIQLRIEKDVNINVVMQACRCLEALAKGLRTDASRYLYVLPALLEKLKERKPGPVEVLSNTLDALFHCGTLSDVLEPIEAVAAHKNPAVKAGAMRFLVRCLQTTPVQPTPPELKTIAKILLGAMKDGAGDVRDAGAAGLGTLLKLVGERPMLPYLDTLDDIKKGKVQEEAASATVQAKKGAAAPAAAPAARAPPKAAPAPAKPTVRSPARPAGGRPPPAARTPVRPTQAAARPSPAAPRATPAAPRATPAAPRAAPAAPRAAATPRPPVSRPAPAKAPAKAAAPKDDKVRFKYSPDDAEGHFADLVPDKIREQLGNSNWKERLEGAQALTTLLSSDTSIDAELLARFLGKYPGWKESNFQVLNEIYRGLQALAQQNPSFDRPAAALTIAPLCDKLGDLKLKSNAGETLSIYAEIVSPAFVVSRALPALGALKAPKAQAEAILWLEQLLLAFGTSGVDIKGVVGFLITSLKSANAAVRANATKAMGTLAMYVGTTLQAMLGDLNPQLRTSIEAEIANAGAPPAPTRTVRGTAALDAAPAEAAEDEVETPAAGETDEAELERLVPRVDVDALLPSAAIAQLGDANWKMRKEGLETIQSALQPHPRLKGSLSELSAPLRARYADNNIMVRMLALDIAAKLAQGMHAGFEPHARLFVPPITQVLADAKAPVRAAAAASLTAIHGQVGLPVMIAAMGPVLDGKGANPTLRQDAFTWLLERMQEQVPAPGTDLTPLLPSVVVALDDRTPGVRKSAQGLLPFLVARAGHKAVVEQCNGLKTASKSTALPLVDAARAQAATLGGGAKAAPKAPAAAPAPAAKPAARPAPRPGVRQPTAVNRTLRAPAPTVRRPAPPEAPKPAPVDTPPFITSDPKYKVIREKAALRQAPFLASDGTVRPDQIDHLQHQMESCCAPALIDALFSKDHSAERDYLQGLGTLYEFLTAPPVPDEMVASVVANTDLLVKYICLRVLDKNTSVALKCFEVLSALVDVLIKAEYHLSEQEGQTLLLTLLQRIGDTKTAFREHVREILHRTTLLCPPSRHVQVLQEHGLASKNARTRAESLVEMEYHFARHGLQVCTPSKTLPVVAQVIGDRDAAVRSAALQVLAEAYKSEGDQIWRLVGPLPPKDESMLEERLKRTAVVDKGDRPAPRERAPVEKAAVPLKAADASAAPTPAKPLGAPSTPSVLPVARMPRRSLNELATPTRSPRRSLAEPEPLDPQLESDLAQVCSADSEESIAALKTMQEHLALISPVPQVLLDALAESVLTALGNTVSRTDDGVVVHHRYVKHVLQTILVMLEAQQLAEGTPLLSEPAIEAVLSALLFRLMDVSVETDEASQTLSKHLNAVVLRVLSTCDPNSVYAACFHVLADATKDIESQRGDALDRATRFAELVIKCLWKVARKLPGALQSQQIHGARLLATVEEFLQAIPPVEWGHRAQRQAALKDIPLITATNVLKQIIDTVGEEALTMLDTLSDPEGSHVYRYLLRLLYTEEAHHADDAAERASPQAAVPPVEDEATVELRGIFDRISQKDQSRAAIRELYEFQKRHPSKQPDIDRSLQNTGPIFQRYIKRALANHAAEDAKAPAPAPAPRPTPSARPSESGAAMDARLAELKAKFRRETDAPAAERTETRPAASTEALRQRFAAMRTEN